MSNKKRWQKLAGIKPEEKKKNKKQLKEGFSNFGLATPGVLGNPFEGRMSQVAVQESPWSIDPEGQVEEAMELLEAVVREAREHARFVELEGTDVISADLVGKIKSFLGQEGLHEAQFAKDALEDIDTMVQPDLDKDYEPNPRTPTMIGSAADEEFDLDSFDPDDEGLSLRKMGDEIDPEYDEDDLADLVGGDRVWPDAIDGTNRGGRKS